MRDPPLPVAIVGARLARQLLRDGFGDPGVARDIAEAIGARRVYQGERLGRQAEVDAIEVAHRSRLQGRGHGAIVAPHLSIV